MSIVHCAFGKGPAIVMTGPFSFLMFPSQLFLAAVAIAAAEFIHTAGCVDEFLFAGKERV